jgi:hypothetical protein
MTGAMSWIKIARAVVLMACVLLVGCGRGAHAVSATTRKYAQVTPLEEPDGLNREDILAEGSLPGNGKFVIFAFPSKMTDVEYELYYTSEGPSKLPSRRWYSWGGGGGVVTLNNPHRSQLQALELEVGGGCGSTHPYALAFGVLRNLKDTVVDRAHGKEIPFKLVLVPKRFHPDGALVYSLLMTGRNHVVTQTPHGRIVDGEWENGPCMENQGAK